MKRGEIFFLGLDSKMMAVSIDTTHGFTTGTPQALFSSPATNLSTTRQYGVTGDGRRFLINARTERSSADPLTVVVNWPATIQK